MGRSGYIDADDMDSEDWGRYICHRGAVRSAIRGKRGQKLLRDLAEALDAMPEKRLISEALVDPESGAVCALGCLGRSRGLLIEKMDPLDYGALGDAFGVNEKVIREIEWMNDESSVAGTPEERWATVRRWVENEIVKETAAS